MAVRKHDFDEQDERDATDTLTLNVSRKLRRRIERLATQHHLSVSEYLEPILKDALPEESDETQQRQPVTEDMLKQILQVREEIMQATNGRVFEDSTELLRQQREERTKHLMELSGYEE